MRCSTIKDSRGSNCSLIYGWYNDNNNLRRHLDSEYMSYDTIGKDELKKKRLAYQDI